MPLNKGDNNVEKEMGESSITKEALIKTNEVVLHNTSKNESGIFVPIQINGRKCRFLVDSGSDITISNTYLLERCFEGEIPLLESFGTRLVSATGDPIPCGGKYEVQFKMGKDEITNKVIAADIRYNGILGLDFMTEHWLRKCVYGFRFNCSDDDSTCRLR